MNSGSAYILGQVPSAAPGSLTFGSVGSPVPQGTLSSGQSLTVTNHELAPISLDGFAFAGANPMTHVTSDTCGGVVEALTTCTASIRFAPQAQGTRTATLTALIEGLPDPAATALTGSAGPPQGSSGPGGGQGPPGPGGGPADLLTAANVRLDGQLAGDRAGTSVAPAGDPNDDGIDDVIVGADSADNNGTDSGSASVIYGRATPGPVDLAGLGSAGFRIDGQAASHNAGTSVAAAGDPNDDGIDDVMVSTPGPATTAVTSRALRMSSTARARPTRRTSTWPH